jgi:ABC-type dipeptide/oligopeptide/nickel transport system permease subunit
LIVLTLIAIFAPVLAPYNPIQVLTGKEAGAKPRQAPCIHLFGCPATQPEHLLGLDGNVRDLFSRLIYGARLSLVIGIATVTFAIVIGTLIGAVAGYVGGWTDSIVMRLMDVLLAFPALLLAIALVTVLDPKFIDSVIKLVPILEPGLVKALIAIGIVSIPAYARVVRASVLTIKEMDFVSASRAIGASPFHLLFRRVLPNALTPLIVQGTLGIASAILESAALSFLGLGAQPPTPEWGAMLGAERNYVFTAPHLVFFPGIAIMLTVLAFNLLGDGLRDALDPRLSSMGIKMK